MVGNSVVLLGNSIISSSDENLDLPVVYFDSLVEMDPFVPTDT
jgi:hypothetical protein